MASRRDELNAYTFAKRRLVAQFLQPSPTGTEEGAPRPLRGVVPGLIVGVLIMAGFGAWGMFKPKAPNEWDEPGKNVIIGSESTTRYVVLTTGKKKKPQLHPVLNLTSAKLLIDPNQGSKPISVDEKFLDGGKMTHGATIGIPYAPDRLPDAAEAGKEKTWVVCERPRGEGGSATQKAAFIFNEREEKKVADKDKLRGGELMYVQGQGESQLYAVDRSGTKYAVENDRGLLNQVVDSNRPQRVSQEWLETLKDGDDIRFPTVPGMGEQAQFDELDAYNQVGMVLKAPTAGGHQHYVVLEDRIAPVTDFVAGLLLNGPAADPLGQAGRAHNVNGSKVRDAGAPFLARKKWPSTTSGSVNSPSLSDGSRNTLCNVLHGVGSGNTTRLSTWAGDSFPAQLPTGSASAYVSPGSGQLFRQVRGTSTDGGYFLVTDTGLRYALQKSGDSEGEDAGIGKDAEESKGAGQENESALARLGFENVKATRIPSTWSQFLPTGPRLSTAAARQPQGS